MGKNLKQKIKKQQATGSKIKVDVKNDTEKYAMMEIRRAIVFIAFAVLALIAASVFLSDFAFAAKLREMFGISKIF